MKRKYFVLLIFFAFISGYVHAQSKHGFSFVCEKAYTFSRHFFLQHHKQFEQTATLLDVSPKFVFSIVAPEIARYQWLQNRMETSMNQVFYVQFGGSYANFSIGYFQMKPKFAEQIEAIADTALLGGNSLKMCTFMADTPEGVRQERISRLNSLSWQMIYLEVFIRFMQKYHAQYNTFPEKEKLIVYSHYYNAGLWLTADDVLRLSKSADYPACNFSQKFVYSHVALEFYLTL